MEKIKQCVVLSDEGVESLMEPSGKQTEIASYIGKVLRDNFGKGPESVYVSIGYTLLTVYIRGFMSPTERVLMAQKQEAILQTTRDMVMQALIPEIKAYVKVMTGMELREFYYDWGLHNKSALFVGVSTDESSSDENPITEHFGGKELLEQEIANLSTQAEKMPEEIYSCQINSRTYVVIRIGILVAIEKQLIRQGQQEQLRLAKRALEKGLLHNNNYFKSVLDSKVVDIFVDWDFDLDKSVITIITNPTK
jgi:uncharacterized protein YbcI